MSALEAVVVLGLGAWRIVHLVVADRITQTPRDRISQRGPMWAYLVDCPWCVGVYVAAGITAAAAATIGVAAPGFTGLAVAAAAAGLEEHFG